MDAKIESVLRKLGLSEGEIKVYLSLVELDNVSVGPIVKGSGVSSSKVYGILDKLIKKGLVRYIVREKTKYFQATKPVSLKDYLESKETELEELKDGLDEVIGRIDALCGGASKEEARIYKGRKGLKAAMFEAISTIPEKGSYYFFSTGYGDDPYMKDFFRHLALELKKRNISIRGLANSKEKKLFRNYYKKLGYSMKYVPFSWPSDVTIAGSFLLILVWSENEPVIYMIESKPLIASYSHFFEQLWKNGST